MEKDIWFIHHGKSSKLWGPKEKTILSFMLQTQAANRYFPQSSGYKSLNKMNRMNPGVMSSSNSQMTNKGIFIMSVTQQTHHHRCTQTTTTHTFRLLNKDRWGISGDKVVSP